MKQLLFILVLFCSCSKEDDPAKCVTCQENVKYQAEGQTTQYYLKSSTEYCDDDSWKNIDGKVEYRSGTNDGKWFKQTTTTSCK